MPKGVERVPDLPPLKGFSLPEAQAPVSYYATKALAEGDPCSVALVIVQGWGDRPNTFIPEAQSFREAAARMLGADAVQPFVVNPYFPRPSCMRKADVAEDGRAIWNDSWEIPLTKRGSQHDDWRGGGDARGTTMSSFDVIDRIFTALADKTKFPNLRRVVLAGYSAGGQFVGRYVAVGKGKVRDGVEVAYVSMAPSTHLWLDRETVWHYGLKDRPRYSKDITYEQILANLGSRTIWYGCGENDTKGKGKTSLDSCPEAVRQGVNRLDRFRNYEKHVAQFPAWAAHSSFHVIPEIAHKTVVAFQFPDLVRFILDR